VVIVEAQGKFKAQKPGFRLDSRCPRQFYIVSGVFSFACFAVRSRIMRTSYACGKYH
jgi:hypothetical protein